MRPAPRTRGLAVRGRAARALTLLEVVISVALVALLLGALLTFYIQAGRLRETAAAQTDRTQLARHVLENLARELRGCVGMETLGFAGAQNQQRLVGDRRSITFLSTALPDAKQYQFYRESDNLPPAQHDLRLISYSLWVDEENTNENGDPLIGGIVRTETKTLNQALIQEDDPVQMRNDLWSSEIGYLEFRYYDGVEWDTKWDITEGNSLPQLVQITVGFESCTADELEDRDLDEYPIADYPLGDTAHRPDRYSILVRIPAADRLFSSRVSRVGKQLTQQLGVEGGQ